MIAKTLITLLASLILYSCASITRVVMGSHGTCCGALVPGESTGKKLEDIQPIDQIDLACKQHDICYRDKGYFNSECDDPFYKRLAYLYYKTKSNERCKRLTYSLMIPFMAKSDDYEKTPTRVCVKTAVLFALRGVKLFLIDKESEYERAGDDSYYAVRDCRHELERRMKKLREISDSQFEHECADNQNL